MIDVQAVTRKWTAFCMVDGKSSEETEVSAPEAEEDNDDAEIDGPERWR